VVAELYKKYFKSYPGLDLLVEDAGKFVMRDTGVYDLIVVDIFEDSTMPQKFEGPEFISALKKRMKDNTLLTWNRIEPDEQVKNRNIKLKMQIEDELGPASAFYTEVNGMRNCVLMVDGMKRNAPLGFP